MANNLKVTAITDLPGGLIDVSYAFASNPGGPVSTPPGTTGSVTFQSSEELIRRVLDVERRMNEDQMLLLHLAWNYVKPNGELGNPNQTINKTLIIDMGAANPIRLV